MTRFTTYVLVAVAFAAGAGFWFSRAPKDTSPRISEEVASTTPISNDGLKNDEPSISVEVIETKGRFSLVPISPNDTIASWSFEGYLNDNGPREAEARKKIKVWESKLGGSDDYQLSVSIAQEYDHLGEGKPAYEYLSRAIAADVHNTTGTAWHNLGILMERLGAYHTARVAHERAVAIQPGIAAFQISRVENMVYHFAIDTKAVEQVFADAEKILGANDPSLIDMRKRWEAHIL